MIAFMTTDDTSVALEPDFIESVESRELEPCMCVVRMDAGFVRLRAFSWSNCGSITPKSEGRPDVREPRFYNVFQSIAVCVPVCLVFWWLVYVLGVWAWHRF